MTGDSTFAFPKEFLFTLFKKYYITVSIIIIVCERERERGRTGERVREERQACRHVEENFWELVLSWTTGLDFFVTNH